MPTYEYECAKCGATFDVYQSIKASPLRKTKCEACNAVRSVRRLIGKGGGIIFKGSGFYQTDYRSESYKKAAKAETSKPDKTESDSGKAGGKDAPKAAPDKSTPSGGTSSPASSD